MTDNSEKPQDFIPTIPVQWDSSWPESAEESDRHHVFSYMEERFGIPTGFFDGYLLLKRGKSWWLLRKSPHLECVEGLKVATVGLRAFQKIGPFIKPTTRMIQIFGKMATKATFKIDEEDLSNLMAGQAIAADLELENGYLILYFKDQVLGLGLLINKEIRSQIPLKELRLLPGTAGN